MENELKEIEEKEIITEEDIDESDTENKKYDESRIYYVYEHIRLDKMEPFYIGKGKGERAYDLYRNDHHDAITDKYGHVVVIIADNLTEEEAYWLERDTIEDYIFNLGYGIDIEGHKDYDHKLPHLTNMDWGGIGGKSGVQHSEEHNKKISESNKGKNKGKNPLANKTEEEMEEIRRKKSESLKGKQAGKNHYLYGKHRSEETKKKTSESLKGKQAGKNHPMYGKHHSEEAKRKMGEAKSKKVTCITTGETFDSIKEANKHYKCNHICDCCKGVLKHAGKLPDGTPLQWKYSENDDNELKVV